MSYAQFGLLKRLISHTYSIYKRIVVGLLKTVVLSYNIVSR